MVSSFSVVIRAKCERVVYDYSYVYPTMDELANQINYVLAHFGIKSFIGFGVGAGSHILAKYALVHPDKVILQSWALHFQQFTH